MRSLSMPGTTRSSSDYWGGPTRWTLIQQAAEEEGGPQREQAWKELIERYRIPVERSVRRQLGRHPAAAEITEEFFGYLFEKHVLPRVDREQGRFRCFIQGVIRNYVKHALRARQRHAAPLDAIEFSLGATERGFEQEDLEDWACAVLENSLQTLVAERPRDAGILLQAYGIPPHEGVPREELCRQHGLTMNALNVGIHRTRRRLREIILSELKQMVASPQDLEDEKQLVHGFLFSAYSGLMED